MSATPRSERWCWKTLLVTAWPEGNCSLEILVLARKWPTAFFGVPRRRPYFNGIQQHRITKPKPTLRRKPWTRRAVCHHAVCCGRFSSCCGWNHWEALGASQLIQDWGSESWQSASRSDFKWFSSIPPRNPPLLKFECGVLTIRNYGIASHFRVGIQRYAWVWNFDI